MSFSADAMYKMSDVELLAAYVEARRQFVEKKFTRDTQRARLTWIKAKMFVGSSGGVTERNMAIDVSEEIARKGQELREMTRDLDLLKVDVDSIAIVIRWRGASTPTGAHGEEASESEPEREDPLSCLVRLTRVRTRHFILLNRTPLPSGRRVAM
jgi:hypothetical protein